MLAPKVARSQTKAALDLAHGMARRRPTLNVERHGPVERALLLQRAPGNQATLRILAQRTGDPTGEDPYLLPRTVQRELVVGSVNDPLEHEADRVAEQMMRPPALGLSVTSARSTISRKCGACEQDEDMVRTKPVGSGAPAQGDAPAIVREVLDSPGQPLGAVARAFFEPRFGHDLSRVRVHTDAIAAESASAINALAYTVGEHTVFAAGQYAPATSAGRRLLAHELVHTMQPAAEPRTIRRVPSVAAWEFHNKTGDTSAADNCCKLCPVTLGVDSHGWGPASFTDGMELRAFLNDETGASYDIKRVRETAAWTRTGGVWSRGAHEGPGKPDDASNDDECLTPQITVPYLPYIYSIDFPGVKAAPPFPSATDFVYKSNFTEGVQISFNAATSIDPTNLQLARNCLDH